METDPEVFCAEKKEGTQAEEQGPETGGRSPYPWRRTSLEQKKGKVLLQDRMEEGKIV